MELLVAIPDRGFAGRLLKVYQAAANAVARLTDIDLLRYESNSADSESADLSLWEQMAPVVRDTVVDVNALLTVIRGSFPERQEDGIGAMLAESVHQNASEIGQDPASRQRTVEMSLVAAREQLAAQVAKLGETIRSPSVVSDRWNLLSEIQAFRTRFRDQIGSLVFDSASAFDYLKRKEVVPGHVDAVRSAIAVRATATDLLRVLSARRQKVAESESESGDLQGNAMQLEKEMDTFGRTPAYRALRAQDKRALIEFRQRLRSSLADATIDKPALESLVSEYQAHIESLLGTLNPEILQENDREVWATVGVALEQAQSQLESAPESATQALVEAIRAGLGLYGRDDKLDGFLRRARKLTVQGLVGPELAATIEIFRELIAGLPVYES
jgi:hypothetical protein